MASTPLPLIGLTGRAQSGKDTVGNHLRDTYGYQTLAVATPIKQAAYALNPIIEPHGSTPVRLCEVIDRLGWEGAKKHPEVRRILQYIGVEAGRDIHGDTLWIDHLDRRFRAVGTPTVAVTDVRFPDEIAWVKSNSGIIVHVERPDLQADVITTTNAAHVSETHTLDHDHLIVNDATLDQLYAQVDDLVSTWG